MASILKLGAESQAELQKLLPNNNKNYYVLLNSRIEWHGTRICKTAGAFAMTTSESVQQVILKIHNVKQLPNGSGNNYAFAGQLHYQKGDLQPAEAISAWDGIFDVKRGVMSLNETRVIKGKIFKPIYLPAVYECHLNQRGDELTGMLHSQIGFSVTIQLKQVKLESKK